MGIYSRHLPQFQDRVFITDAGLETELVFQRKIDLPQFAAYDLLRREEGYQLLYGYFATYAELGARYGKGLVLETPTWRANRDWGQKIGDSPATLDRLNRKAVELLLHVRDEHETADSPIVISGNIGPRGDGYVAEKRMSTKEAREYHQAQITSLTEAGADIISALTMNYVEEAIGIVQAAQAVSMPVVISFTLETDGRLYAGDSLEEAIAAVDRVTGNAPAYYMINCAHPAHFEHLFAARQNWISRVKGIRGNASCRSHQELDNATNLDDGDPDEFGAQCHNLHLIAPQLNVMGGCCGTDHRHVEAICRHF